MPRVSPITIFACIALMFVSGFAIGRITSRHAPIGYDADEVMPPAFEVNADMAMSIARQSVIENDNWEDDVRFRATRKNNGTWSIFVEQEPPTNEGWRLISLDKNGNVIDYMRGR